MNKDVIRLSEIQLMKKNFGLMALSAETEEQIEYYYSKINELKKEEKEILKRID